MKRQTVTHPSLRRALFAGSARFGNILLSSRWNPERRPRPREPQHVRRQPTLWPKSNRGSCTYANTPSCSVRNHFVVGSGVWKARSSITRAPKPFCPKSDGASRATSTLELPSVQRTLTCFHNTFHPILYERSGCISCRITCPQDTRAKGVSLPHHQTQPNSTQSPYRFGWPSTPCHVILVPHIGSKVGTTARGRSATRRRG